MNEGERYERNGNAPLNERRQVVKTRSSLNNLLPLLIPLRPPLRPKFLRVLAVDLGASVGGVDGDNDLPSLLDGDFGNRLRGVRGGGEGLRKGN
jgi:hypothetical protein